MQQHFCPRCAAPIRPGQLRCAHCALGLDTASLHAFAAWQAQQPVAGYAPPAAPVYAVPPPGYYSAPPPPQVVIVTAPKEPILAFLLTLFFGPLGMLYSTVPGALIMLLVGIPVTVLTGGLGACLIWPICVLWALWACYS